MARAVSLKTILGSPPTTMEFPFKSETPSLYLERKRKEKGDIHSRLRIYDAYANWQGPPNNVLLI